MKKHKLFVCLFNFKQFGLSLAIHETSHEKIMIFSQIDFCLYVKKEINKHVQKVPKDVCM